MDPRQFIPGLAVGGAVVVEGLVTTMVTIGLTVVTTDIEILYVRKASLVIKLLPL